MALTADKTELPLDVERIPSATLDQRHGSQERGVFHRDPLGAALNVHASEAHVHARDIVDEAVRHILKLLTSEVQTCDAVREMIHPCKEQIEQMQIAIQ